MSRTRAGSFFEKNLSQESYKYINSKYQLTNDSLDKLDLRTMTEEVMTELEVIENESAFDYLKVENEILELTNQVASSDEILQELENLLFSFKENLNEIKDDMTNLQERSIKMNTCIDNRKKLQYQMNEFLNQAVLEPELIDNICNQDINEKYVDYIRSLCKKLDYLQNINQNDSSAVKELEPELNKLKKKACQRVNQFLMEKLNLLKKPQTNIQIMQQNVFCKYKIFLQFLRDHFPMMYIELCNNYADIMGKIYYNNFKLYTSDLSKLMINLYQKSDILIPDQISNFRNVLMLKGTNYVQGQNSIFSLMQRDCILNEQDDDPIVAHVSNQTQKKYLPEKIFKSVNKLFMDSVQSEYNFTLDFFGLKQEQNKVFFGGVFKQTLQMIMDFFKNMIANSFDCQALVLINFLNEKNKKFFQTKTCGSVLDYYFEQINIQLWPRFEFLFEGHLNSLRTQTPPVIRSLENQIGLKILHQRMIDLQGSLQKLYQQSEGENKMLLSRFIILKNVYFDLIRRAAREDFNDKNKVSYLIKVFDMIQQNIISLQLDKKEFQDDLLNLEKEINGYIDRLVELYLQDYFQNLVDFVRKYAGEESEKEMNKLNAGENMLIKQENNEIVIKQSGHQVNFRLIENIAQELSDGWNKRVETVRKESENVFSGAACLKIIIKKFLTALLAYYNTFFKYVKQNHSSFCSQMVPVHQFMKENSVILKNYQM